MCPVAAGEGLRRMELTLEDLKSKFKHHTVSVTLQCTGNRRREISAIKPVQGLDWDIGAIGNATWTGVRLSDVLKVCCGIFTGQIVDQSRVYVNKQQK